jgi:hypothetical protein
MSWLETRLPKWRPFGGGSTAVLERDEGPEPEVVLDDNSPKLMILVNDASGMACFKTHSFPDAKSATEFIVYWFRHDTEGFSAFWAMRDEPSREVTLAGETAEPLVIINDAQRTDVVYSFSFVDIESAQAFVDDEVVHGTEPDQIKLYWALPVRLLTDANGKTILSPSVPPGVEHEADTEVEPIDRWAAHDEPPVDQIAKPDRAAEHRRVLQEAPNARTGVANGMSVGQETFELSSWIERARKKPQGNGDDGESPSVRPSAESRYDFREDRATAFEPSQVADETPLADLDEKSYGEASLAEAVEAPAITPEVPAAMNIVQPIKDVPFTQTEDGVPYVEAATEVVLQDVAEAVAGPLVDEPSVEIVEDETDEDRSIADPVVAENSAEVVEEVVIEAPSIEDESASALEVSDRTRLDQDRDERLEASAEDSETDDAPLTLPVRVEDDGRQDEGHEQSNGHGNGFITLEPGDLVVHTNGHSKVETSEPPAEVSESPEATIHVEAEETAESEAEPAFDIRIDIHLGSARAMKVKRFEVKENPFDGFKSPPGRF